MSEVGVTPKLIASPWHTGAVVAALMGPGVWTVWVRHGEAVGAAAAATAATEPVRGSPVGFYLGAVGFGLGMVYLCWAGVHWRGGGMRELFGERWRSWGEVARDVVLVAPFFIVWEAVARVAVWGLGPDDAAAGVQAILPRSGMEVLMWWVVSVSSGVCEELVFRGYLQQQFRGLMRSRAAGVIVQAVIFGFGHLYKGWKQAVVIGVLGVLYGVLAGWRRNLGTNMMAHTLTDVYEGWIRWL